MKVILFYSRIYDCWAANFDGYVEPMPNRFKREARDNDIIELYIETFDRDMEDELEIVR